MQGISHGAASKSEFHHRLCDDDTISRRVESCFYDETKIIHDT